ncbi:hypothetical protein PPSIR1_19554 [Plesiocystis pacifica SIR-1]|uniref:Uncharacterized protein n=1 Tax=Plesiocystis pacifica SIR-1 TaxID=391625 RepID=A6GAL0_9BACT|nr:hypothetical protein [Plesiocystis pacifica]EDM77072.1 hypothetical protein PPSIR1_19554 [Plesiocystis pacifica SIR-1]
MCSRLWPACLVLLGACASTPSSGTTTQPDAPPPTTGAGADADADGIPDAADACPAQPEDPDAFEDDDGCPDADNDDDGVPDLDDHCPDEPEDPDGFQDDDGCHDDPPVTVPE